ncbi:hypothetical protein UFOVP116_211 [uncultured Caudovirales phage]|uniref:Uncharacterized protein n=1 Tax=uncultured Caudovirales phage TaxID=2100421 RepID=A0A6J5L9I6_9CAUD|nr:hypothetical protein UFOVP116_211 [uncultured Caudovirales phage]
MKIRAIVNGISFYTTRAAIKRGVGDHIAVNESLQRVLALMGKHAGMGTTVTKVETRFDVQLNVL